MELFAHPFGLNTRGVVATVTQDTDAHYEHELARLLLTHKGERDSVPTFGVTDPTFAELDTAEVNAALAVFGPPVRVVALERTGVTDTAENLSVEWELADDVD